MDSYSNSLTCIYCKNIFIVEVASSVYCSDLCRHLDNLKIKKDKLSKKEYAYAYVIPIVEYLIEKTNHEGIMDMHGKSVNYYHVAGFNESIKQHILERDQYQCRICLRRSNLHIHHIIPRLQGGSHEIENLITLCASCHSNIETKDMDLAKRNCIRNFLKEKPKVLTTNEILSINLANRIHLEALYETLMETPEDEYLELDKKTILLEFAEIIDIYG